MAEPQDLALLHEKLDHHAGTLNKHIADEDRKLDDLRDSSRDIKADVAAIMHTVNGNGGVGLAEQVRDNSADIARLITTYRGIFKWLAASLGAVALAGIVQIALAFIRGTGPTT